MVEAGMADSWLSVQMCSRGGKEWIAVNAVAYDAATLDLLVRILDVLKALLPSAPSTGGEK